MIGVKDVEEMELRAEKAWEKLADDIRKASPQDTWDQHKLNLWLNDIKPTFISGFLSGWRDGLDTARAVESRVLSSVS